METLSSLIYHPSLNIPQTKLSASITTYITFNRQQNLMLPNTPPLQSHGTHPIKADSQKFPLHSNQSWDPAAPWNSCCCKRQQATFAHPEAPHIPIPPTAVHHSTLPAQHTCHPILAMHTLKAVLGLGLLKEIGYAFLNIFRVERENS